MFKVLLFLVTLSFVLCSADKKVSKHIHIPLFRQKTPRQQIAEAPNLEKYGVYTKWLKNTTPNVTIALYRFLDSEFYGQIVVGSPGKTFQLLLDTTWSYSWILSSDCDTEVIGCWFHDKYNHKKSSTYRKDGTKFSMNEGTYNFTGYFSNDTFSIGKARVNNQSFIEMTSVPYTNIFSKADGLLGLGLKMGQYNPFLYNILQNGTITKALFSVYLNRDKQSNRGGDIYLGAIEERHIHATNKTKDPIVYLPVDSYAFWQFEMDKVVTIDDKRKPVVVCANGCTAIADTSNNLIIGPKEEILIINKLLSARSIPFFGRFYVDCDNVMKLPPIDFILSGQKFSLTAKQYTQKMSIGALTLCVSAFTYSEAPSEQNVWVMGGAFLSVYYSIYDIDNKKIGFVRAA